MEGQEGYEVIKLIEHDGRCHVTMDCAQGRLLGERLKEEPWVSKGTMFAWFQSLVTQIEQYHRCKKNQCYRYLNPWSVLVCEDDTLLLLDLEAASNEFVIKNMQRRMMRRYFVKKVLRMEGSQRMETDLYSLGKTIQYILAHAHLDSKLTRRETYQLSRIISKCLGDNPKKIYQDFKQIQKQLPKITNPKSEKMKRKIMKSVLAAVVICLAFQVILHYREVGETDAIAEQTEVLGTQETQQTQSTQGTQSIEETQNGQEAQNLQKAEEKSEEADSLTEQEMNAMELDIDQLMEAIQQNTEEDNRKIIEQGTELERKLLRYLAIAYDREEMIDEALSTYGRVCSLETDERILEKLYLRKAKLEQKNKKYEQARNTYREALEKMPGAAAIANQFVVCLCGDETLTDEDKEKELQFILGTFPEIVNDEEFQKLQQEYGIEVEGEKIWLTEKAEEQGEEESENAANLRE